VDEPPGERSTPTAAVTWLGHSTVVIELDGTRVVTDPLLSRRITHLWRFEPVPAFEARADVVAVSHVHWDHLHAGSLARLAAGAAIVVPRGSERLVSRLGFERVVGVRRGDVVPFGAIEIEITHADHGSLRRGRTRSDAVGFVFRGTRHVYFAGDTDVFDEMSELAGTLDAALLPVAGWGHSLPPGHLDVAKAVRVLELMQPRIAVPIHWGTLAPFGVRRLGGSDTVAEDFRAEAAERVPHIDVRVLRIGDTLALES
jgi:L-ascorbate metabolism protein UlaG (beta-lactamase superfamily)